MASCAKVNVLLLLVDESCKAPLLCNRICNSFCLHEFFEPSIYNRKAHICTLPLSGVCCQHLPFACVYVTNWFRSAIGGVLRYNYSPYTIISCKIITGHHNKNRPCDVISHMKLLVAAPCWWTGSHNLPTSYLLRLKHTDVIYLCSVRCSASLMQATATHWRARRNATFCNLARSSFLLTGCPGETKQLRTASLV